MSRYRPIYVALHWVSALLILLAFLIGLISLANQPNDERKLIPLGIHVALGIGILALSIARVIVRSLMGRPVHKIRQPTAGKQRKVPLLDVLSVYVHPLLYLFTFLMSVAGIWLAIPTELFGILFLGSEKSLPPDFYAFPARAWHGTLSLVLMVLIGQHILAFVYHQFLREENFIGRMWFTKKSQD
jgi:cytochrome b561